MCYSLRGEGAEPGQYWAGWAGSPNRSLRKLKVLAADSMSVRVEYLRRGEGRVQETLERYWLTSLWEDHKQHKLEYQAERKRCDELRNHLQAAFRSSGIWSVVPYIHSGKDGFVVYLSDEAVEILTAALAQSSKERAGSLEQIFASAKKLAEDKTSCEEMTPTDFSEDRAAVLNQAAQAAGLKIVSITRPIKNGRGATLATIMPKDIPALILTLD